MLNPWHVNPHPLSGGARYITWVRTDIAMQALEQGIANIAAWQNA